MFFFIKCTWVCFFFCTVFCCKGKFGGSNKQHGYLTEAGPIHGLDIHQTFREVIWNLKTYLETPSLNGYLDVEGMCNLSENLKTKRNKLHWYDIMLRVSAIIVSSSWSFFDMEIEVHVSGREPFIWFVQKSAVSPNPHVERDNSMTVFVGLVFNLFGRTLRLRTCLLVHRVGVIYIYIYIYIFIYPPSTVISDCRPRWTSNALVLCWPTCAFFQARQASWDTEMSSVQGPLAGCLI